MLCLDKFVIEVVLSEVIMVGGMKGIYNDKNCFFYFV